MQSPAYWINRLADSKNPSVAFKAGYKLKSLKPDSSRMKRLHISIQKSENVKKLLAHREKDGTIKNGPYRKWQGPHWTLVQLSQLEYPPKIPTRAPNAGSTRPQRPVLSDTERAGIKRSSHPRRPPARAEPALERTVVQNRWE